MRRTETVVALLWRAVVAAEVPEEGVAARKEAAAEIARVSSSTCCQRPVVAEVEVAVAAAVISRVAKVDCVMATAMGAQRCAQHAQRTHRRRSIWLAPDG